MLNRLVIGSENQIRKYVRKLPLDIDWKWCYFGVKIDRKKKLEKTLGRSKRYHYAKELYDLSRTLKQPFLDWMSRINSYYRDDLSWWATRFASKSPLQTNFFLFFCYFNLIDIWSNNQASNDKQLLAIIIEDPHLHCLLKKRSVEYNNHEVQVNASIFRVVFSNFYYLIKSLLVPFVFLFRQLYSTLINVYLKTKFRNKFNLLPEIYEEVMLCTFIEERGFSGDDFNDCFFGSLAEFYRTNSKTVAISSQINLSVSLKKKAFTCDVNFRLLDFYLGAKDWLSVLFMRPSKIICKDALLFNGVNYAPLYVGEYNREKSSLSFSSNLCLYFAYRNYFKKNKQLKLFIYLFENQPWEKLVLLALRSINVNCISAGYQHTTMPPMLLNYFLGEDEHKFSPVPDYIITNGSYHEKLLKTAGYKTSKIINGGSLRYKKDFFEKLGTSKKRQNEALSVLILLTSSLSYSLEVIYGSIDMLCAGNGCKIYVKPHPDLFNKKIEETIKEIEDVEVIRSGSMEEVLSKIDAVVYSGTTAALEAFYKRLPVFKVATELIDLDVLEDLNFTKHYANEGYLSVFKTPYFFYDSKIEVSISEPLIKDTWLHLASNFYS